MEERFGQKLSALATRGIYWGTSSWKYPGWLGKLYDPSRYQYRGRWSKARFDRSCLREYAKCFPTVCGDFGFYRFPTESTLENLFAQLPPQYEFSLKIPEEITVERWPAHARYGRRAGKINGHFMDATLLREGLLEPLLPYKARLGALVFEFGNFYKTETAQKEIFVSKLGEMLRQLPTQEYKFAVEVRNTYYLYPGYFETLGQHGVSHCFNSWTYMPDVLQQIQCSGGFTASFCVARFLLRPGRSYQQAVDLFEPYEQIQDRYQEGREAMEALVRQSSEKQVQLYIYVNNRLEGCAIDTIEEVVFGLSETAGRP